MATAASHFNSYAGVLNKLASNHRRKRLPSLLLLLSAAVCTILGLFINLAYGPGSLGHVRAGGDMFSPHASVVFPVSGLYCDEFRISRYSSVNYWNASMYLLHEVPSQTADYEFRIQRGSGDFLQLEPGEYRQWSFNLLNGSRYSVSACAWVGSTVNLHVLNGTADFHRWTNSRSSDDEHVLPYCNREHFFTAVNITSDSKYYFVYDNNSTTSSVNVSLQMNFTALDYVVQNASRNCSCSDLTASCPISLPISFRGIALVQTSAPKGTNWEDERYISWNCEASYYGYMLLFILPITLAVIFSLLFNFSFNVLCNKAAAQEDPQPKILFTGRSFNYQAISSSALNLIILGLGCICAMLLVLSYLIQFLKLAVKYFLIGKPYVTLGLLAATAGVLCCNVICKTLVSCTQIGVSSTDHQPETTVSRFHYLGKYLRNFIYFDLLIFAFVLSLVSLLIVSFTLTFVEGIGPIFIYSSSLTVNSTLYPGDTKVVSFNNFFCKSYTIEGHGSSNLSAELYISKEEPPRSTQNFTVDKPDVDLPSGFEQSSFNLYLREQSVYSASLCLVTAGGGNANFVVIKGTNSFYSWPKASNPDWPHIVVNNSCDEEWNHLHVTIKNADRYYFVVYHNSSLSSTVHLVLNLSRSEYSPPNKNRTISSCPIGPHKSDKCTAIAPGIGEKKALILVSQYVYPWTESMDVLGTCNLRGDTWTALWVPLLVLNFILLAIMIIALRNCQKSPQHQSEPRYAVFEGERKPLLVEGYDSVPSHSPHESNAGVNNTVQMSCSIQVANDVNPADHPAFKNASSDRELVASDAASNHEAVAVVHVSAGKAVVDNADTTASVHTATASDVDTTSDDEVDNDTATDGDAVASDHATT